MSQNLVLKKFNINRIKFDKTKPSGPTIVLLGKRNTGKSFLVRDILFHHQDVPVGTVISGTEDVNPFYSNMVPKAFIHNEYSSYFIENLMKRQKHILNQIAVENATTGHTKTDGRAFVILDDCAFDRKVWTKDKLIQYIFMNGRHMKIMLMITMQYPMGLTPELRTNIDFVFILRNVVMTERKKIYDHYAGIFPSFEAFCQIMDNCTDNYECLVIDNTVQSNRIEDVVFWYKASDHPQFKLGSREYWEMSKKLDDDQPFMRQSKVNQIRINVKKLS